jgi:outer membrane protein assembly factor BamD (BamD/ComL family)
VAEEVEVLTRAHTALRGGSPDEALAALDEHARRFPKGALAEERSSERVLALCAAGRKAEAHVEGERFLRLHPRSFFAARVRGSCAAESAD